MWPTTVPSSPTRATSWTALKQKTTWITIYQPTNIKQRLQLQVQYIPLAKWSIQHFYHHQTTAIFTYWNSMELWGREEPPQISVTCLCPSVVGMLGKHQDTATLWSDMQHGGILTTNIVHGLQHTWITLTILKHIHHKQHIYKYTSMV
jgi:hypothetical protein